MTHMGNCLTASGVRPIVSYQHKFSTTYLYGSYSPVDGDSFVWEINGTDTKIFEAYLREFSKYRPEQFKIIVIDNAGFHSTKNFDVPKNIYLLRIPPYTPELNPCEQVWQWIKNRYKNQVFESMDLLKQWLHKTVNDMNPQLIKSITANHHYLKVFNDSFNS